ncbi:MAG: hypothetical protein IJC30_03720 [Alphaproteobacteria bacterium]|nr:hypothetical protein [Alphaproteobacteria bacterium]
MKKLILTFFALLLTASETLANPACPVCTVAIGGGLAIARKLGVDDSIVAVWAGALLAILGYWLIRWVDKKRWLKKSFVRDAVLMALSVGSIGFMYISELSYDPQQIGFIYIDPFLFSTLAGAFALIFGVNFYEWMKKRNKGHAHFPFEKVVVPLLCIVAVSIAIYYTPVCLCGPSLPKF